MLHYWSVTYRYLATMPNRIISEDTIPSWWPADHPNGTDGGNENACIELQRLADAKKTNSYRPPIGKLEFDDFSDEIHAFFYRNGKRIRFANIQYEGTNDEIQAIHNQQRETNK